MKKPHIELCIQGEDVEGLVAWIRKRYDVTILSTQNAEETIPIEETEYWREMEKNRIGNLLAGARHKAGLTQAEVARKLRIRQNMVSDFERGRRALSPKMAERFAKALPIRKEHLLSGGEAVSVGT